MDEMKNCTQCGAELPSDALFCPECGTRQSAEAVSAPSAVSPSVGSNASYDPFAASPQASSSAQPPVQTPVSQPVQPPAKQPVQQPIQQPVQQPLYQQPPYQSAPAGSAFQYAQPPVQQQNPQHAANMQGGMNQNGMQPGFPQQAAPGKANPVGAPAGSGKKLPIVAIVFIALLVIGLLYWFFRFFNPNLDPYSFGDLRSNALVFAFLLMTIAAVCSTVVLRVQTRGSKMSILANILLGLVVFVMLYGISIAEFSDKNLFFKLFMNFTK